MTRSLFPFNPSVNERPNLPGHFIASQPIIAGPAQKSGFAELLRSPENGPYRAGDPEAAYRLNQTEDRQFLDREPAPNSALSASGTGKEAESSERQFNKLAGEVKDKNPKPDGGPEKQTVPTDKKTAELAAEITLSEAIAKAAKKTAKKAGRKKAVSASLANKTAGKKESPDQQAGVGLKENSSEKAELRFSRLSESAKPEKTAAKSLDIDKIKAKEKKAAKAEEADESTGLSADVQPAETESGKTEKSLTAWPANDKTAGQAPEASEADANAGRPSPVARPAAVNQPEPKYVVVDLRDQAGDQTGVFKSRKTPRAKIKAAKNTAVSDDRAADRSAFALKVSEGQNSAGERLPTGPSETGLSEDYSGFRRLADQPVGQNTGGAARLLERYLSSEGLDKLVRQANLLLKNHRQGEIRLLLKPEQLGQVRVRLQMQGNQVVGRLWVDNPATREVFQNTLAQMQAALLESGFDSARLEVSIEQRASDQPGQQGRSGRPPARAATMTENEFNRPSVAYVGSPQTTIDLTA